MKLDGKAAVITGAGSGVGRASALLFVWAGAQVVVGDVMDHWAAETVRLVTKAGGTAVPVHCDVTPFEPRTEEYVKYAASLQPNGQVVSPEDCAAAALFLASDDARNITGILLPVDGGYTAR
jgi:NAD(P)-dependent dehydrogenase (short-subunit alcohol dehydrogenase family)